MSGARERILARVRHGASRRAVPPNPPASSPTVAASFADFADALAAVGGTAHGPLPLSTLPALVEGALPAAARSGRRVVEATAAAWLPTGGWEVLDSNVDPCSLADVRVAAVRGTLGVAENGAVAVLGRDAPNRAVLFLAEHLVLLLEAGSLATDLEAAFRSLPPDALHAHHLTWISGPSKTADIEQVLVMGAHGPRTLQVIGVETEG